MEIEEGRSLETTLNVIEGFQLDSGYLASAFITDERRNAARLENALVLVTDYKLENVQEMLPVLELVARDNRPLIIVAEAVEQQALAALIMNTVRGTMKILAIKPPRFGQERRNIMQDLAISTGATFVTRSQQISLSAVTLQHLGKVKSVDCLKNSATFMGGEGKSEEIDKRIDILTEEIKQTDDIHECETIQERITRLASGVSIINVGGATEVEMIERKHRIEDALEAVRSAQAEGLVCGGGMALLNALKGLEIDSDNDGEQIGCKVLAESLSAPFKKIAENCGLSPDVCYEEAKAVKNCCGYNFLENRVENLLEVGIVDPAKVVRCALQNAVSAAGVLITTNHAIVQT
jgi:chaperonin GroEL